MTLLIALLPGSATAAADKIQPPRLPVAERWSYPLVNGVGSAPVSDGTRIYLSLRSGYIAAYDLGDGHNVWLREIAATVPMAVSGETLFVAAGEAIQALRGSDAAAKWTAPRVKPAAPLLAAGEWVIAVTDAEVLALHASDGTVGWRHPAGGVRLVPAIDGDLLYIGADDGRVLALKLADGSVAWEQYVPLGVTALAARNGRVYAGAGDKSLYCLDGRKGTREWSWHAGAIVSGRIAVDDERVYFTSLNNVVWGLDRSTGNQRWQTPLRQRPTGGVVVAGHVVFVAATGTELLMLFDRNGHSSGILTLPGETIPGVPPEVRESGEGLHVVMVTGGLSNVWQMTCFGPGHEMAPVPFDKMEALPGLPYLTDPRLEPAARVLQRLIMDDPFLREFSTISWPVVLTDPPLQPLTVLPGLQLRPLSPVLPVRRGG
jgi:outer membrane protein assembly factor BamB